MFNDTENVFALLKNEFTKGENSEFCSIVRNDWHVEKKIATFYDKRTC